MDTPSFLTHLFTLIGSYQESTVPIDKFIQPELMFLHEVGSNSVCAMNVPNYYGRNPEIAGFVRHDNQMGSLVIA